MQRCLRPVRRPLATAAWRSGTHTFRVRAIDGAGNVDASPAVYTWSIDTTAPNTTITGTPGTASNNSSATFTFSSNQANSTFQCSLDGAGPSPCASPVTYSNLTEGSHNFQVRATDAAGNADPTPASFSWTVDTVVPDTTIVSSPPSLSNSGSASFTFSSTEAGATFQCNLDGGSFTNCSSPRTYSGLLDGLHTFQVRARDAAGNIDQTPASYSWTVDRTAPSASIASGPPTPTNVTTASFTFTSNDPTATFQCRRDGAAFAPCVSPVTTLAWPTEPTLSACVRLTLRGTSVRLCSTPGSSIPRRPIPPSREIRGGDCKHECDVYVYGESGGKCVCLQPGRGGVHDLHESVDLYGAGGW